MKKCLIIVCGLFYALIPSTAFAYLDPATGNAMFTLAVTIISAALFGCQYLYEHFFLFRGAFKRNKNTIPLLLYSEGNAYRGWFEPILDELEKRRIKTVYYTSAEDDFCFQKNYRHISPVFIGKGNRAYAKMAFVKADIVLMTTPGLDVYQLKRSRYVKKYVHFYHGCDDQCFYKLFGVDYYDALLTDSEINGTYVRELEHKRNLPAKELVVVGNIKLDELQKRIKDAPIKNDIKKTILLAPSWGRESCLYKYGNRIIELLLKTDCRIIIRPHPQMKIDNPQLLHKLQNDYPDSERLRWDFDTDNLPSMLQSDLMISDFSSIVFEYAFVLHKPVITLSQNINLEQYDASDLSAPVWRFPVSKEIGEVMDENQMDDLPDVVGRLFDADIKTKIETVADIYWTNHGKCVENIVDYIEKQLEGQKDTP